MQSCKSTHLIVEASPDFRTEQNHRKKRGSSSIRPIRGALFDHVCCPSEDCVIPPHVDSGVFMAEIEVSPCHLCEACNKCREGSRRDPNRVSVCLKYRRFYDLQISAARNEASAKYPKGSIEKPSGRGVLARCTRCCGGSGSMKRIRMRMNHVSLVYAYLGSGGTLARYLIPPALHCRR